MHNRGRSREMYREAVYEDVAGEIVQELERGDSAGDGRRRAARSASSSIRDSGSPNGQSTASRRSRSLDQLTALDRPILVGPSRKSYLTMAARRPSRARTGVGHRRGSCRQRPGGAHIVRVHGVREMADVVRVADRIRASEGAGQLLSRPKH